MWPFPAGIERLSPAPPYPRMTSALVWGLCVSSKGVAKDTTVYLRKRGEALKVNISTFTIRASDSPRAIRAPSVSVRLLCGQRLSPAPPRPRHSHWLGFYDLEFLVCVWG